MPPSIADLPWLPPRPADFRDRCRALDPLDPLVGSAIQRLANYRLDAPAAVALGRAIARCRSNAADLASLVPMRLAIVSNATVDLLLDSLPAAAARHGIALEPLIAPYDQVMQQALDPASATNQAAPDIILMQLDQRWLQLDRPVLADGVDRVAEAAGRLRAAVAGFREHCGAPVIVQTVPALPQALFGSFDRRVRGTARSLIDRVNAAIVSLCEESGSYLLDVAAIAEQIGTDRWFDPVHWCHYKIPFAADCDQIYADALGRLLGAIRGKARKCLVLDLDNTIWGGVIGDDGIDGIILGQGHPLGEAFLAVQQTALDLRERGVILAVSSKNDDETARLPFREHRDMLLRETHIAAFQANWLDKPSNLEAIAKTLNLGIEALVLLDDNPAERAQVRAALPMVAVPELPRDVAWYPWFLCAAGYFEAVSFSAEDTLRVASYAADAQRAEVMVRSHNLADYLVSLEMTISFSPFDRAGRPRIAQLINKTNQFNLTTRRYTETAIADLEGDAGAFTLQVRLRDRFGDLGMIAVVICQSAVSDASLWEIDTWLMSCRVLGRKVEEAMLAEIVAAARRRGIHYLVGVYRPTTKNDMVKDHYAALGFEALDGPAADELRFKLDVARYSPNDLPLAIEHPLSADN